jgi:6-phosphogluconolactonase (cycloisomerase 2 family)
MRRVKQVRVAGTAAITAAVLAALGGTASASVRPAAPNARWHNASAVFVQTDNPSGNEVVAYRRAPDGTLTEAGQYATGGLGGILAGSQVDHLASQGSLAYDARSRTLIAVNAGSDTVSVFGVRGDRLHLRQVTGSGGTFPVSVAIHGSLVYVLNALGGGEVQGYRLVSGTLAPLPGSARALGLNPTAAPQYTNTPGQVSFSPDGSQLIITTKANGNDIDVYGVIADGTLSATPAVNAEPGAVPFAITFDRAGHLVIAEAGTDALATFSLNPAGTVTQLDAVATNQSATCWVTPADGLLFASNAGSGSVSGFADDASGDLTLLGQTPTDPGTVDSAASPGGRFLYVQTGGSGIVDEFSIGQAGNLTEIGSVTVPGAAGGEGIVAS